MIVFLKAQLFQVIVRVKGEESRGLLVAGTFNKWTKAHKNSKTEINKDESSPLPKVPGVLYWLLLWLLHYWIKSLRLHLRARETEKVGRSEGMTFSNGHIDRRAKKEIGDVCGGIVSF